MYFFHKRYLSNELNFGILLISLHLFTSSCISCLFMYLPVLGSTSFSQIALFFSTNIFFTMSMHSVNSKGSMLKIWLSASANSAKSTPSSQSNPICVSCSLHPNGFDIVYLEGFWFPASISHICLTCIPEKVLFQPGSRLDTSLGIL